MNALDLYDLQNWSDGTKFSDFVKEKHLTKSLVSCIISQVSRDRP